MSASVGGHGGIEEEDRALSCLSVHMLCFRHLHECVGAFVFKRVLSTFHLVSLFCPCCGSAAVVSVGGIGWQYRALSCCCQEALHSSHHSTCLSFCFSTILLWLFICLFLSFSVVD